MKKKLQPILDIIDEGLRLYRHGFLGFVLVSSIWFVPLAIGVGTTIAAARFWSETVILLVVIGWILLLGPLAIYLVGGLSHATLAVQRDEPIALRKVLAIRPLRAVGMGFYSLIFFIAANILVWMLSTFCFCPIYVALLFITVGITTFVESSGASLLSSIFALITGVVTFVAMLLFYGLSLLINGAIYSGLVYGLQAFIQEESSFSKTIDRSINLIFYRLGRNILAFMLTSFVFAATAVSVTVAVGGLLSLPLLWALGPDSPIAQGGSAIAWILGFIVVMPPLPIWMVLLYQDNLKAREALDLEARIEAFAKDSEVSA